MNSRCTPHGPVPISLLPNLSPCCRTFVNTSLMNVCLSKKKVDVCAHNLRVCDKRRLFEFFDDALGDGRRRFAQHFLQGESTGKRSLPSLGRPVFRLLAICPAQKARKRRRWPLRGLAYSPFQCTFQICILPKNITHTEVLINAA